MNELENNVDSINGDFTELNIKEEYRNIDWTKNYEARFKIGDLVVPLTQDGPTDRTFKVCGFARDFEHYHVVASEELNGDDVRGQNMKLAPEGSTWMSWRDANNPLKKQIPGIKISCPSNKK